MQQIIEHLQAEGYNPGSISPDGKIHRYQADDTDKKKSAFYIAHRNFSEKTGEEFYVICYGSWRGDETKTFCTLKEVSTEDRKSINKKIKEMKRRSEANRLKEQEKVAVDVVEKFEGMGWLGANGLTSPYLDKKRISDNGSDSDREPGEAVRDIISKLGVKIDGNNTIYIPARDSDGRIWSWQSIKWDGTKMFHPGGRIRGCFHTLGDSNGATTIYVTEGFATAASVFMATEGFVVCTFFASNLIEVGKVLRKLHPDKKIVVCGDNDLWTTGVGGDLDNVGKKAAEEAAAKCLGKAILPDFTNLDSRPTDFNDLHCLEGLGKVKEQVEKGAAETENSYLLAIGFKEKEYFFTSSENQQIVAITRFTKTDFLNLMPLPYWEATFPGSGACKVDWDEATSVLMDQARSRGIFEAKNVRGAGAWNDRGRVVVNMGDYLIVDGRRMDLGDIESRYFYSLGIKMPELSRQPLSAKECEVLLKACHLFRWKRKDFGYLLAGAMVTTRICGALPIRPHIWVTGEKGSGKTTLFNKFIYPIIGEPLLFAAGNSTEAGVRQRVCADAVPVLFDEFENVGVKSQKRIQEVLDLMRLAWSDTHGAVIKGSASGVSTSYTARFAAIVTSIRQVSMTDADRSRFATVELGDHGNDVEHWRELSELLSLIDETYGARLFARSLDLVPVLLGNFELMKKALSRRSPSQRFSDQYGMLLAGYSILLQDGPMDAAQADILAGYVSLDEEKEDAAVSDQGDALERLLTCTTFVEYASSRKETPIGKLIKSHWKNKNPDGPEKNALSMLGIRVESEFVAVVATNHAKLESSVFRGTRWSESWSNSLKRLPGATKRKIRIDGQPKWCVHIPTKVFDFS